MNATVYPVRLDLSFDTGSHSNMFLVGCGEADEGGEVKQFMALTEAVFDYILWLVYGMSIDKRRKFMPAYEKLMSDYSELTDYDLYAENFDEHLYDFARKLTEMMANHPPSTRSNVKAELTRGCSGNVGDEICAFSQYVDPL